MTSRLGLVVGLMACLGMGCRDQAAVRIILSFPNFKPGCVRMSVQGAEGAGTPFTEEYTEQLAEKTKGGVFKVAAFPSEDWGKRITVKATAFEQTCGQGPEFVTTQTVGLGSGITAVDLTLDAVDGDGDGYVSRESGGSDCADGDAAVHPGRTELCNNRDDNCNSRADEGFERVGQQCGSVGACQTWVCNAEGGTTCQEGVPRWYRDQDGDGEGTVQDSKESCTQPAGYVNNSLDCDDSKKARFSAARELCNGINDNCDEVIDEGYNVGTTCSDGTCGGTVECTTSTQSACTVVTSTWYPDADGDTHGQKGAGQKFCGSAQPANHVASSDDCDDTRNNVYPGARELCDSLDNDCNNRTDEGFVLGEACTAANACAGVTACTASGTTTECKATLEPTQYYVDNDLDTYGKDLGPLTCNPPAGHAPRGGDCQDGNSFIHPGQAELCDQEDNDCDSLTDEDNACPAGGAAWTGYASTGSETWRSVALYTNGGVWVAGENNLHLRANGTVGFQNLSGPCSEDVTSIAANFQTGEVLIGGNDNFVARYLPSPLSCTEKGRYPLLTTDIKGVTAVLEQNQFEAHFVGVNTAPGAPGLGKGRAFRARGSMSAPQGFAEQTLTDELTDVHGLSRGTLFAVGGPTSGGPGSARIYRFNASTSAWAAETVPADASRLNGVWVTNAKLAHAVGNNGTLLVWNGNTWSKVMNAPNEPFSSVVAFGSQSVYVASLFKKVYRYDGSTWTKLFEPTAPGQFLDIAANNPGDIWVVGNNGQRYHWPQ